MDPSALALAHQTGATPGARVLVAAAGVALAVWTLYMLRNRSLLVSLGSIFLSVSGGLVVFAFVPAMFDRLSYAAGVYYPPLLYLIVAVLVLMMLNVHLAARLSALDLRCRRIVQEVAIQRALEEGPSVAESATKLNPAERSLPAPGDAVPVGKST